MKQKLTTAGAALLGVIALSGQAHAGSEQLGVLTQIPDSTIIQGYQEPLNAEIYNFASPGSDTGSYSVYVTTPTGTSAPRFGMKIADGGANYVTANFFFNSTNAPLGLNTLSSTLTDTVTNGTVTSSKTLTVLSHPKPAFYIAGQSVPLASSPPSFTEPPSVSPEQASATGGSSFAAAAPAMLGDPPPGVPTAEMDLDSITATGDPQITLTLADFTDLPPDNLADAPPDMIDIDGSLPGTYHTTFELNYSDEQDLPGADAPGSEHAFFDVIAVVPATGDPSVTIIVPEPGSISLLLCGAAGLLARRRRRLQNAFSRHVSHG